MVKTGKNEVIGLSNESDGEMEGGLSQKLKLIEQKVQQVIRVKEEMIEDLKGISGPLWKDDRSQEDSSDSTTDKGVQNNKERRSKERKDRNP